MSPAQSRWFFAGFTVVLAIVVVNAHRQPSRVASTVATAQSPPQSATKPAPPKVAFPPAAPAPAPAKSEPKDQIRLATVSAPVRTPPRLPSAGMVGQLPLPSVVDGDVDVIRTVQKELVDAGYGPLLVTGNAGPLTRAAVMAFEHDQAMALSGEISERLLRRLRSRDAAARPNDPESRRIVTQDAEQVVIIVQKSLAALSRVPVQIDGRTGTGTETAIRAFETEHGMKPSGRISADLFSTLARAVARTTAD